MDEEKKLYIPVNIRRRKEYIDGVGRKEVLYILISFFAGIFIGIVLYFTLFSNLIVTVGTPFIFGSGTLMFTRKDKTNRSSVDYLLNIIKFNKGQKTYKYKYHNVYEKR